MDKFKKLLRKMVHNPYLDIAVGLILVFSGMYEAWETFPDDFANSHVRTSHAVVILGFVTVLKALTDMFAGLEFMDEASQVEKEMVKKEELEQRLPLANKTPEHNT